MIYAGLFSHSCQLLYSPAGYWIVHCLLCSGMIVLVLRDLHLASVIPDNKKMTNYPSLPIGWRWKWVRGLWELCGWKHRHRIVRHLRRGCWRERESVTLCNRIVTQLPDHICPTLLMVAAKNCELVYFCARIRNYYASEIQGLDSYGGWGGGFLHTVFSGAFTWGHLVKLGQFYINDERKRSKTNTWIKTSCLIRTKVIAAHKSHHAAMAELHYRKV